MEGRHQSAFFLRPRPRRGPSCVASRRAARCSLVYRAASFRRGRRRPQTPGRRWAAVLPTWCVVVGRGAARPRDDGSPRLCRRVAGVAGRFGRVAPKPVVCNARWEARRDSGQRRRYRGAPTLATLRRPRAPGPTLRMALSEQPHFLGSDRHTSCFGSRCKRKHNSIAPRAHRSTNQRAGFSRRCCLAIATQETLSLTVETASKALQAVI